MGPSAVLRCCLGVKSVEALQSCPGITASGYSFTQAPGMRGGAEDEVAREAQRPTVLRATEALPRKGAG